MLLALCGDTHFGARNDSIVFRKYFHRFYDEIFWPTIEARGIKHIIQVGDFFDKRKNVNISTLKWTKEIFMERAKELGVTVTVLIGNHDSTFRNTIKVNSPDELLAQYDNFNVVSDPVTMTFDGYNIDIVPWICEENRDKIYDFMSVSKSPMVVGHFEFKGFEMAKGVTCTKGIDTAFFNKYDIVKSGHFHIRCKRGVIDYIGTPYEMNWGDCGQAQGFVIFDTADQKEEYIVNPLRLHHKIFYDDRETDYIGISVDEYKDAYIKIVVVHKSSEGALEDFIDRLWTEANPIDIAITDISVAYRPEDIDAIETQDPLGILISNVERDNKKESQAIKELIHSIYKTALMQGVSE